MGIYGARGIELHLLLKTGQRIVLLDQTATDKRLLDSRYFAEREQSWFENLYGKSSFDTKIDDANVIEMTDDEKASLEVKLQKYGDNVDSYGWYDVVSYSNTYEA